MIINLERIKTIESVYLTNSTKYKIVKTEELLSCIQLTLEGPNGVRLILKFNKGD